MVHSLGELLLVFPPELEFLGAEDASLLLESLGDLSGGVVDVDNSVLFHGDFSF